MQKTSECILFHSPTANDNTITTYGVQTVWLNNNPLSSLHNCKGKNVKVTLEQAMKVQRGSKVTALPFP